MSKAYKGMTKIVAETATGGPYVYMENPYAGTIGAKGETWAEQIICVVDAVETAVERHFEAENERLRAALKRIRQTHQRLEEDANEDMLDDTILEMDEIAKKALGDE
jgi:hypothetical protein